MPSGSPFTAGNTVNILASRVIAEDNASASIYFFLFFLAIGVGILICFLVYKYAYGPASKKVPTTANMETILADQKAALKAQYERIDRMKALVPLATNKNFLVNYHCLGQKDAGYLGPYENGVIDEASAVPLAIANGARVFVLQIEDIDGKPMIVARDGSGKKVSLNDVHAGDIINDIVNNVFKDSIEGRANVMRYDPCVIYLKFKGKPSAACAASVAAALGRMKSVLLTENEKGDFTYCRNESKLFLLTPQDVAGKIIIVSNIDASDFAGKKVATTMKSELGYFINGRVWSYNTNSPTIRERAIYEIDYSYLRGLNEDGAARLKADARLKWFLVGGGQPSTDDIQRAKEYGMQCIGGFVFENKELRDAFSAGGFAKKSELCYVVPDPIQIAPAPKEMNSGGGFIVAPKLG